MTQTNTNWEETTLGKVCEIQSGSTPSTKENSFWGGEIAWITPKDLSNHNSVYISKGERNITLEGLKNSSAQLLPKNTILFSSRAPIGYVAIAQNEVTTNQGFKNIICDEKKSHFKFFYYLLKEKSNHIEKLSSGSTFSEASASLMKSIEILLPPLPEQKAIASVLSSFDDKIELLREENKTLESLAQTIFHEQFGKYRPTDSLPEGWRTGKLQDIIDLIIDNRGKTPPTVKKDNHSIPLIEVNSIVGNRRNIDINQCKKFVTQETYNSWFRKGHPHRQDVLISTVGSIGQLAQVFDEKICIAQNIVALRFSNYGNYLYELLKSIQNKIISIDISSVQPSIKVPHLLNIEIIIPSKDMLNAFEQTTSPISHKISNNNFQIQSIAQSRDELLPKLMNGLIKVRDLNFNQ